MPQRIVVSASRRTDIPAFYMPWFMNSIDQGFFEVTNPYNNRISSVPATPDRVHTIVFWSKNYGPFLSRGDGMRLTECGYHLFFNFTINSHHRVLEPMLPPLNERLAQLTRLAESFGPQCIQWRFDPICFFRDTKGGEYDNLDQFTVIAGTVAQAGIRTCITSFVDIYAKVARRLKRHTPIELFDPPMIRKIETITAMSDILKALGIELQLCCEKGVLEALPGNIPVQAAACIPNDRLSKLYGPGISLARDRGQRTRSGCQCRISKDVGSYNQHPCSHDCLFCYANPAIDSKPKQGK